MHVELVDLFRCVRTHEDSCLVAAAHETRNRVIIVGVLGCPVCGAEYPIHNGVVASSDGATSVDYADSNAQHLASTNEDEQAFRLAAQLNLDAPGKTIALLGVHSTIVHALAAIAQPRLLLIDCDGADVTQFDVPAAVLTAGPTLPVADASLDAIATTAVLPTNAVQCLRSNGRLVAPLKVPVPDLVDELARDNLEWVAAREMIGSKPVPLRRHSSP